MVGHLIRLLLIFLVIGLNACSPQPSLPLQIKAISPMERVEPFAAIHGEDSVNLFAAQREYEGFQAVIRAGQPGIKRVQVQMTPLVNAQGDKLDQIKLYREHYIQVTTPSPFSPYAPRFWPDLLLPQDTTAAVANSAYRAFPQDLAEGENLPVWVDVYVPARARPGVYTGKLVVTADQQAAVELPVSLKVWNFTLPERSPLRTVFGTNGYRIAEIYGFERTGESATDNQLIRAYNDFLLDHYLSPESFWDATPESDANGLPNFKRHFAGLGTVTENMQHYLQTKQASAYTYVFADHYPFSDPLGKDNAKARRFMQQYAQWCHHYAGQERCYTDPSFVDEPDTPQAYEYARRWGDFFDALTFPAGQSIRYQVSEPPLNENPTLGNLQGKVDVWIPKFYDVWRDVDYLHKNVIGQRVAAGEEVWAYTSLVLDFNEYKKLNPRADPAKGNYPPVWQMDFPAINYRLPLWLLHQYGITGLGYWDTVSWSKGTDIWNNAASFISEHPPGIVFNGDGLLIYPGTQERTGKNEPLPSLRLKWLRDAIEDYQYIDLLEKAGEKPFVSQQIHRFARHWGDWDNAPVLLMQVRQALGEKLEALHRNK